MIVLSVPELRQRMNEMHRLYGLESACHEFEKPNDVADANMNRILDQMEVQHLEANDLTMSGEDGWGVIWRGRPVNGNRGRYCHIECTNDGAVCAIRTDYSLPSTDPNIFQFWWISDVTLKNGKPGYTCADHGELELTLEETLEHIRCYIWADYGD